MNLKEQDRTALKRLEEDLWREVTRFDKKHMDKIMAPDFFEIGRSGRIWSREECLAAPHQPILTVLPLSEFNVRLIQPDVAQTTYCSAVTYDGIVEYAQRSSIWTRSAAGWILRFHQGTPTSDVASHSNP